MHTLTQRWLVLGFMMAFVGCTPSPQTGQNVQFATPSSQPTQSVTPTQPVPSTTSTPIPRPSASPKGHTEPTPRPPVPTPTPTPTPSPEPQPSRPANLAEGLVAHYAFENNLNSHDGLRNGEDPPQIPDIEIDPDDYPKGFFPGSWKYANTPPKVTGFYSDYPTQAIVRDSSNLNIKQDLTFSFWYRLNTIQSNHAAWPILSDTGINSGTFALYWTPGGAELILNKGNPTELWVKRQREPNFNLMQRLIWQHWVASYDGSKVKIYLNGQLNFEVAYNKPLVPISEKYPGFWLGRCDQFENESGSRYLDTIQGDLDELRIYNRALKPEEVEQLYQYR